MTGKRFMGIVLRLSVVVAVVAGAGEVWRQLEAQSSERELKRGYECAAKALRPETVATKLFRDEFANWTADESVNVRPFGCASRDF